LLRDSGFRAGCPVVAVSVEAGDPAKPDQSAPLIERAAAAFRRWTTLIAERLAADGIAANRAGDLALLIMTSFEGAIVVSRATRELTPLDNVHRQLRTLVQDAQRAAAS
jgi:hypothetical protein